MKKSGYTYKSTWTFVTFFDIEFIRFPAQSLLISTVSYVTDLIKRGSPPEVSGQILDVIIEYNGRETVEVNHVDFLDEAEDEAIVLPNLYEYYNYTVTAIFYDKPKDALDTHNWLIDSLSDYLEGDASHISGPF